MTNPIRVLLVVVGEARLHGEIPLYEYLVRRLRQLELAGATAIRAEIGFGHHEALHRTGPLELSTDRPVVVFAVDHAEKIDRVLAELREIASEGLVVVVDGEQILPV